ncbi:hypothetical protein VTO73DRAFT_868 [Trametes versicolor]
MSSLLACAPASLPPSSPASRASPSSLPRTSGGYALRRDPVGVRSRRDPVLPAIPDPFVMGLAQHLLVPALEARRRPRRQAGSSLRAFVMPRAVPARLCRYAGRYTPKIACKRLRSASRRISLRSFVAIASAENSLRLLHDNYSLCSPAREPPSVSAQEEGTGTEKTTDGSLTHAHFDMSSRPGGLLVDVYARALAASREHPSQDTRARKRGREIWCHFGYMRALPLAGRGVGATGAKKL